MIGVHRRVVALAAVLVLLGSAGTAAMLRPGPTAIDHPLVRQVDVGGHPVTLVVTPGRPGRNLVQAFSPHGVEVRLPSGPQVELPRGRSAIDLVVGPRSVQVSVRLTGPRVRTDVDEECASRALGAALAHRAVAATCAPPPAGDARLVGAALARDASEAGVRSLLVLGDDTPRGRAAAGGAVGEARRLGLRAHTDGVPTGDEAMILVGGWPLARRALASGTPGRGSLLAPWLLQAEVVSGVDTQVTVASEISPTSAVARAYLATLGAVAPGVSPSAAGLAAFAGPRAAPFLELWTPAEISFLPPALDAGHDHTGHGAAASWLPVGQLALVRSALWLHQP